MKSYIFCMSLLFGILSSSGCASTPRITTHSYALVNPATETALIESIVVEDEVARMGIDRFQGIVTEAGGKYTPFVTTDEHTVIVRTTSHAHAAIRKVLDESRKDIEAVKENYNK